MMVVTSEEAPRPGPVGRALATVLVRCRMPARRKLHNAVVLRSGDVISVDHVWMLRSRWAGRDESSDPAWLCYAFGPFVLAFRIED